MADESEQPIPSRGSVGEVLAKGIADIIRIAAEPEWIPVTERLPPDRTVVLAWSGKRVAFGYISYGNWIDPLYGLVIPNAPTHWMPLPAPPEK
jgi:hypothetical protein